MSKYIVFLVFIFLSLSSTAQIIRTQQWLKDSAEIRVTAFEDNKDGSVYTGMYEILKGIQPLSYVGGALFKGVNRPFTLKEGEGRKGYIFEACIDQTFTIAQGRNGSNHRTQRGRVAIRYAPSFRMARDSSSPLIPSNQKIGFEFDYAVWNNYTKKAKLKNDYLYYARDPKWINSSKNFSVVHLIVQAMHYSNGQPPGVFLTTFPVKRHNYLKGDFSTNFLSIMGVYSLYSKEHRLYSMGLGYRKDGSVGGPLGFTNEQEKRYGKHRMQSLLQYRTAPKPSGKLREWINVKTGDTLTLRSKTSFRHRLEMEYIIGNLDSFDRAKKSRFGLHWFTEIEFAKSRAIGAFIHFYYGRNYMNIRYDDIIRGGNIGLTFTLAKYHPPRQKSSSFIVPSNTLIYDAIKKKEVRIKK
jgi:hypothetical protein